MRAAVFEQIGDYKIIERIGHGGMGEVWLANKVGFQGVTSACVIKLLHAHHATNPKSREYFINEARLAAQLDHPNIVKVFDAGEADGRLYLVMDRVDGSNLTTFLNSVRRANLPLPLAVDITCYIIGEVLTAFVYAHGRTVAGCDAGVVHYDVTPNNILISSSGCVMLTDFGLSRVAAKAKNVSFVAGTPRYMSIEHHVATPRLASDIYGLGVVLHELLSNTRYHDGLEPKQIQEAILHGVIQPLPRDDLPPWLVQLRTQMLAADYTQRPAARVALEIILRNVPGYRRAATELAKIYKDVIGPARSGMTKFLSAVPDQQQSFFTAPDEPRVLVQGAVLSVGPTQSTPPPMRAAAPSEPTLVEPNLAHLPIAAAPGAAYAAAPGAAYAAGPSVVEESEPTEMLPGFSQPYLPVELGRSGVEAASQDHAGSADVATATTSGTVAAAATHSARERVLLGVAAGLGTIVFVGLGWILGTHGQRGKIDEQPVAAVTAPEPELDPKAPTEQPEEPQRAPPESEPSEPELPPQPVVVEPRAADVPDTTETETAVEPASQPEEKTVVDAPPAKPKSPVKKEKSAQPVKIVLYIKGHNKGTIKIGRREHAVNVAAVTNLAPGRYAAKWRTSQDDPWHSAGTLVVGNVAPKFYEFRLTDGAAERSERTPGKGQ